MKENNCGFFAGLYNLLPPHRITNFKKQGTPEFVKWLRSSITSNIFHLWQCLALVEGLLQHGRLTFEQLVMRATSTKSERKSLFLSEMIYLIG